jgi:hypothetical protein
MQKSNVRKGSEYNGYTDYCAAAWALFAWCPVHFWAHLPSEANLKMMLGMGFNAIHAAQGF